MECEWFTKPQRRINNLSKTELHRHTPNQRNTLHRQKLLLHTKLQIMPYYPPRRNSTQRYSNTHKRINPTLRAAEVRRRVHSGNFNKSKRIPIRDNRSSRLLSTQTQLKKGTIPNILSNTRTKVYSGRRLQQQTHIMGLQTNNDKGQRIVKGHTGKKLLIPINRNANILAYRR